MVPVMLKNRLQVQKQYYKIVSKILLHKQQTVLKRFWLLLLPFATDFYFFYPFRRLKNMLRGLLVFFAGVYTGIYISQNYEIPRVDDPEQLIEKLKDYADKHKKE